MDNICKYIFVIIIIILLILRSNFCKKDYFKNNQIIEKNIFQTAWSKKLPKKYVNLINKLKKQNPEYEYYLFDDNDMEKFVREKYPKYWESFNMINDEYIVAKSDYFRYMVVYHYGGVYFDLKSGSKVPLRKIIKPNDEMIIFVWENKFLNKIIDKAINWCIIAKKKHPLLKIVLDTIHNKILNYNIKKDGFGKDGVLSLTGPKIFEKVVYENIKNHNVTVHDNLYDNKLVYNYLDIKWYDDSLCDFYNKTNGLIGRCTHTAKKKNIVY